MITRPHLGEHWARGLWRADIAVAALPVMAEDPTTSADRIDYRSIPLCGMKAKQHRPVLEQRGDLVAARTRSKSDLTDVLRQYIVAAASMRGRGMFRSSSASGHRMPLLGISARRPIWKATKLMRACRAAVTLNLLA
jgi:hypothetical protein